MERFTINRIFFFSVLLFNFGFLKAEIINVGKNQSIKTILEGIKLAKENDTVLVQKGIYKEPTIYVNKTIVLKGVDFPTIDGQGKYENIIVMADNAVVEGFTINNSGQSTVEDYAAVRVSNCDGAIIRNNRLNNNYFGIYVEVSSNAKIEKNTIRSNAVSENTSGDGIHCFNSKSLVICYNDIKNTRDGIYLDFVTESIIVGNHIEDNIRYGLHFMFSHHDTYILNYFKNNSAGVAVMYSNFVKMIHNYFVQNWGDSSYGLYLKEMQDSTVTNNFFIKNTTGIVMEGSSRSLVSNNQFLDNGWAMRIQASSMEVLVEDNNFLGNIFDVTTNGTSTMNTFRNNYWDKCEAYDLDRDGIGDVPYHPLSLYTVLAEKNASVMLLFQTFFMNVLDKTEKVIPSLTPENFVDSSPRMKKI